MTRICPQRILGGFLLLALSVGLADCGQKRAPGLVGPMHDFDWPIEAPKAPTYDAILRERRLSDQGKIDRAIAALEEALRVDPRSPFLLSRLAYEYVRKNDLEKAEAMAHKAVAGDPKFKDAHYLLGKIYSIRREWDKGEREFQIFMELDEEGSIEGPVALAGLYVESQEVEKAVAILSAFIEKDPRNVVGYYYLGRVYSETNQLEEALKAYEKAVEINPGFSIGIKAMALIYEYKGQMDEAIKAFGKALEVESDNADLRSHLAQIYIEQEQYDKAIRELAIIVTEHPEDHTNRLRLGLVYVKQEKYDKAQGVFAKLLQDMSSRDQVRYYLAIVLEKLGKTNEAVEHLKKIKKDSSVFGDAKVALAFLLDHQGKTKDAEKILTKAIKDSSQIVADLYIGLASLFVRQKRNDEAVAILVKGLARAPKDQNLWFSLAEVYEKMANFPKMEESILKVIAINPDNANALNYLGYTYAEKGIKLKEAEQLIKRALEIRPKDGFITDSLGWIYFKNGQYAQAISTLEEAIKLAPNESILWEHLGDALAKLSRVSQAKEAYEQAMKFAKEAVDKKRIEGKIQALP